MGLDLRANLREEAGPGMKEGQGRKGWGQLCPQGLPLSGPHARGLVQGYTASKRQSQDGSSAVFLCTEAMQRESFSASQPTATCPGRKCLAEMKH